MRTRFTYDRIDPRTRLAEPGDIITSARCAYRVHAIEPVDSRVWHDRWRCTVEKLGDLPVRDEWRQQSIAQFGSCVVIPTEKYPKGDGPVETARRCGMPTTAEAAEQLALDAVADAAPAVPVDDEPSTEVRFVEPTETAIAAAHGVPAIADIRARHFADRPKERR